VLEAFGGLLRRLFSRGSTESLAGLDPERTRVIVGLGNPGPEYADTRHNVGFRCVDLIATRYAAGWQSKVELECRVAVVHTAPERPVVLVKPQTYMNRSGRAIRQVVEFLGVSPRQCLVIYDEMDLPFGTLRLRERGGPGTHNGMRSVIAELQTEDVARLRVGIGQSSPGEATSHVLSEFSEAEAEAVREVVERAVEAALAWAEHGAAVAMNRYNC
jgi:peptidyl-tRNA hydrolase, PTH1 family